MSFVASQQRRRFVQTSIYDRVYEATQFVIEQQAVSLVVGRAGNGKTTAIQRIVESDDRAIHVECRPHLSSIKGFLRAFMDAAPWWYASKSGFDIGEAAEACASQQARVGRYLLVDEYQNYDLGAVREALRLNEKFGLPVVLVGNFARLRLTKAQTETFEQITSRIWKTVKLGNPIRQDFINIGVDHNLEGQDGYEELVVLGHNTSIREAVHVLETARALRGKSGSLNVEHLREAVSFLTEGGTKNLGLLTPGLRPAHLRPAR